MRRKLGQPDFILLDVRSPELQGCPINRLNVINWSILNKKFPQNAHIPMYVPLFRQFFVQP